MTSRIRHPRAVLCALLLALSLGPAGASSLPELTAAPHSNRFT